MLSHKTCCVKISVQLYTYAITSGAEGGGETVSRAQLCRVQASPLPLSVCGAVPSLLSLPFKLYVPGVLGSKSITVSAREIQFDQKQKCDHSAFRHLYHGSVQPEMRCNCTPFLLCTLSVHCKLPLNLAPCAMFLNLNLDSCLLERPAG